MLRCVVACSVAFCCVALGLLCYIMLCFVLYDMLRLLGSGYAMLWYIMIWYVMLGCVMLCYIMIWYVRRISQLRKCPHAPSNGCQGKAEKKPVRSQQEPANGGETPRKFMRHTPDFLAQKTRKLTRAGTPRAEERQRPAMRKEVEMAQACKQAKVQTAARIRGTRARRHSRCRGSKF